MPKSAGNKHLPWNFIIPLSIVLVLLIIFGLISLRKPESEQMSLLFLIHAEEAKVTKEDDGWKLVLADTDPRVQFFSDRPKRLMGQGDLGQFLISWNDWGFVENPPNAAISFLKDENVMMVSLEDPSYDSETKELSFIINPLQEIPESLENLNQQTGEILAKTGKSPTVFIDNAILSSNSEDQTPTVKNFLSGMPIQEHSFHIHWKGPVFKSD